MQTFKTESAARAEARRLLATANRSFDVFPCQGGEYVLVERRLPYPMTMRAAA